MAIPSIGGMTILLLTLFVMPILYAAIEETKLYFRSDSNKQLTGNVS